MPPPPLCFLLFLFCASDGNFRNEKHSPTVDVNLRSSVAYKSRHSYHVRNVVVLDNNKKKEEKKKEILYKFSILKGKDWRLKSLRLFFIFIILWPKKEEDIGRSSSWSLHQWSINRMGKRDGGAEISRTDKSNNNHSRNTRARQRQMPIEFNKGIEKKKKKRIRAE